MRKSVLLLASMALALLLASGVASAATIHCPNDPSFGSPSTELYCWGTSLADTMFGSDLTDAMYGKSGADTMHGYGARDYIEGDNGSDHIYGDAGADYRLWGGGVMGSTQKDSSNDYVHGGSGGDRIDGGFAKGGVDRIYGEGGNDFIYTAQRDVGWSPVTKEIIDCGAGQSDTVTFDKGLDVVRNCEIRHGVSS